VPVVSSNATCLPEVYEHAAHYFNPNDTTDMARAINDVLSDESLKKDLVVKGYTQIKKYSWRRMAEQTHATYIEALATTNLPEQL
jgi:glycosyltransferase involved in cell wall biosynthesis